MPESTQAGDVLAGRYHLDDLLAESRGGRFWLAQDSVLHRPVAVHIIPRQDERADALLRAARAVGPLEDRRLLRVLDADVHEECCYVVNEWGEGVSLDLLLDREGPLEARRAAWLVAEVADTIGRAHEAGLAHGRLAPENVLVDHHGQVRIIGFGVDAALLGLPEGRVSVDVTELAALLYAALTSRWPGVSPSQVPEAPSDHGLVLRPRQVRAGIPRPLDAICDQVLNPLAHRSPRTPHDLTAAHGLRDALREFVGDITSFPPPAPAHPPTAAGATVAMPAVPPVPEEPEAPEPDTEPDEDAQPGPVPDTEPDTGPDTEPDEDAQPGPVPDTEPGVARGAADGVRDRAATSPPAGAKGPTPVTDLPTQAGMPVFHDDSDDVEWLRKRSEAPEPPPPFEEPTPKPLFAPDPPDGQPARRPRPGSRAATEAKEGYWPWEAPQTGTGTGTGTGGFAAAASTGGWGADSSTGSWGADSWREESGEQDYRPGRSWIRLALVVAFVAVVLALAVGAYQLGVGRPEPESTPSDRPAVTPAAPTPFADVTATDFDPQGAEPREEYPELVGQALDGDPATAWRTATYEQQFGPAGLKTGVGLVLDLGATKGVREVVVDTGSGESAVSVFVTGQAPTTTEGLSPVGQLAGTGEQVLELDEAVSGRFVTVWLTALPAVEGGFRGTVNEVQVKG